MPPRLDGALGRDGFEALGEAFEGGDRLGGLGAFLAGARVGGGEFGVPGSEFGLEGVDFGVAVLEFGPERGVVLAQGGRLFGELGLSL